MMALVEPPMANSTRNAFSTERSVMICDGRSGFFASSTARAARFGCTQAIGMHGRNRRRAGQRHAERFGYGCHRRRGAHHGAGAGGGGEVAFDLFDARLVHLAGAMQRPEAPAVGAGTEAL